MTAPAEIKVFAPGTPVRLVSYGAALEATVIRVSIEQTAVTYEIAWLSGPDRKTVWVQAFELQANTDDRKTVAWIHPLVTG